MGEETELHRNGGMAMSKTAIRLAALADLHCGRAASGQLQPLFTHVAEQADILLLCGDLTDHGLPEEARVFVKELASAGKLPIVAVLGNHDCHSGKQDEIAAILRDAGVQLLDGDSCEIHGVGFAGVKGFGGGFGRRILEPFGEGLVQQFVHEAVNEALKLEIALARLRPAQRIAVLHYAPIAETVEGEPPEIHPFLGCSRLEEPINRHKITAVFHGHAHHGRPEGKTSANVPVYNVAVPLLRHTAPDRPPFRIVKITLVPPEA